MKTYTARIEGTTPLLQHRFSEKSEVEGTKPTRLIGPTKGTPREQAELSAYRNDDGTLWHPGAAISRLLREAGANHKIKGSRKSVKFAVPSAVIVLDESIPIESPETGEIVTDYEVDSRPVVNPSTKGRIMSHRPRHDKWAMTFHLEIDDDLLPTEFVHQLLEEGGRKLGIGDFRPEKGGPFGRFAVTSWKNGEPSGPGE